MNLNYHSARFLGNFAPPSEVFSYDFRKKKPSPFHVERSEKTDWNKARTETFTYLLDLKLSQFRPNEEPEGLSRDRTG